MGFTLFTAAGCARCQIVKHYMNGNSIGYEEVDFKADGKEAFNAFYRKNRSNIYRGAEGVEFPLLFDGEKVVQGVGVIIAFLKNEKLLDSFVARSDLCHGWVSGLSVSDRDKDAGSDFFDLVSFLKVRGLLVQIDTDGRNAGLLESLVKHGLIDRLIFNLKGPADLYEQVTGTAITKEELSKSLSLLDQCKAYQVMLQIQSFQRQGSDTKEIMTPDEAAQAAEFVEQATGKKTHPFFINHGISSEAGSVEPVNLFAYRTACRRYMVKAEIYKDPQPTA